ncbi:hypothetical protein [Methanosarcina siciliae]|uniref:hypothetical protein n=1 Tax=Methanosarcina siciliae TaxID=38027 RepID=UPI00064FB489|nr:hypothetical protein [Methanosarcina siciliae]
MKDERSSLKAGPSGGIYGIVFGIIPSSVLVEASEGGRCERVSYKIEINNSKSEAQDLTVVEHLYGDWKILESSDKYRRLMLLQLNSVTVPAKGTITITDTAENRF